MLQYNPEVTQNPSDWLAMDEEDRIQLIEEYHHSKRIKMGSVKAHAMFHSMVENQIVEGVESVVHAMDRLIKQGLSRHDAIHAIGSIIAEQFYEATNNEGTSGGSPQDRFNEKVNRLNAKDWLRRK